MNQISKNRYLDAALKTLLVLAVIHFILLITYSVTTVSFSELNLFNIIELYLFLPNISKGLVSGIASAIIVVGMYLFFYFKK
jgi:hypothetical protein